MPRIAIGREEFLNNPASYLDEPCGTEILIMDGDEVVKVILAFDDYRRPSAPPARKHYFAHELPDEWVQALKEDVNLDHLDP